MPTLTTTVQEYACDLRTGKSSPKFNPAGLPVLTDKLFLLLLN